MSYISILALTIPHILAKVPLVLFLLPEYVEAEVQGICIGTNDLSQFLLRIIPDLVRWGIQAISVEATAVTKTYWAIARAEQSIILDMARKIKY